MTRRPGAGETGGDGAQPEVEDTSLLNRRSLLAGTAGVVGSMIMGSMRSSAEATTESFPDDPTRVPGHLPTPYGQRSTFETAVRVSRSSWASLTPLQESHGILTPSALHFERHHNGVPTIHPARHRLLVIEDAAHALLASYRDRPLGGFGQLAAVSFHETKNVITGEGGALLVNEPSLVERAEVIWEKGTNRKEFFRGKVDKYTWVDVGSSYLPSEVTAAFLWAQLEMARAITERRCAAWQRYHEAFGPLERAGRLRRPVVPASCRHNGHMYYLLLPDLAARSRCLDRLQDAGVNAIFHYVPLHSAEAGLKFGRFAGDDRFTTRESSRILRLPLYHGLSEIEFIAAQVEGFYCRS